MGNAAAKGGGGLPPPSRGTSALHEAISRWDAEAIKKALGNTKAAPDVNAYRVPKEDERFVLFALKREAPTQQFALSAFGRLANEVLLSLLRQEREGVPVTWTADTLTEVVTLLVSAGADPNAEIEKTITPAGEVQGAVTVVDAWRLIVSGPRDEAERAARGKLLAPSFLALLRSPGIRCVSTADLALWASLGHRSVTAHIATHYGDVRLEGSAAAVPPLLFAIDTGNTPLAKQLLDGGADPNVVDADGCSALMHATGEWDRRPPAEVGRRSTVGMLELLLQHGADVGKRDHRGRTALHHFAASKSPALSSAVRRVVLVRCIRSGADINAKDAAGVTPTAAAEARGDAGTARVMAAEVRWLRRRWAVLAWARQRADAGAGETPKATAAAAADAGSFR